MSSSFGESVVFSLKLDPLIDPVTCNNDSTGCFGKIPLAILSKRNDTPNESYNILIQDTNGLVSVATSSIYYIKRDMVLESDIKHLKYSKQLNIFDNGKKR